MPAFGTPVEKEEKLILEKLAARLQASEDSYLLGAFVEGRLVGPVRFRFEEANEKHRGLIVGLYVEPAFGRRGFARALLSEVLGRARASGLHRI